MKKISAIFESLCVNNTRNRNSCRGYSRFNMIAESEAKPNVTLRVPSVFIFRQSSRQSGAILKADVPPRSTLKISAPLDIKRKNPSTKNTGNGRGNYFAIVSVST